MLGVWLFLMVLIQSSILLLFISQVMPINKLNLPSLLLPTMPVTQPWLVSVFWVLTVNHFT
ncbi:uncharacterized protein BX664DRAFT_337530 [Halteromyces radiatus]|uniref:uncharacterized protein n=1 Tax=Halteromyces radiatus TaxID=101107 RepID=UPI00221FA4B7|nr:uncharacterized protein BX664DRAFT_337530 [Halteromyces radiatus]KAI8084671.1 hypothetical protein BX664DRAFT_337530 [Halteromyces radiatus]